MRTYDSSNELRGNNMLKYFGYLHQRDLIMKSKLPAIGMCPRVWQLWDWRWDKQVSALLAALFHFTHSLLFKPIEMILEQPVSWRLCFLSFSFLLKSN